MAADAATVVKNWQAAMQGGVARQKYIDAINRVQGNPMEAAAAAVENGSYLAGVQAAIQSGKMAKKLRAASVSDWKANAVGPGAANLQTGATKGLKKMQAASALIAQAGASAQAAAKNATGPLAKVAAAINAVRAAHGYGPVA